MPLPSNPPMNDADAMQSAWDSLKSLETQLNIPDPLPALKPNLSLARQKRITRMRFRRLQRKRSFPVPLILNDSIPHFWSLLFPVYQTITGSALYNSLVGFNLDSVAYGSYYQPFKNLFLGASYWFSNGSQAWLSDGQGGWFVDTNSPNYGWNAAPDLVLDEFGYPSEIAENCYADRILKVGGENALPAGDYVVLWTGDASFGDNSDSHYNWAGPKTNRLSISGTLLSEDLTGPTKRATFRITGGMEVRIRFKSINPADPIRNLIICRLEDEATIASQPFDQSFLDKMAKASAARLMDIMRTNHNPATTWATRVPENYCIQQCEGWDKGGIEYRGRGLSYELLCDLVNAVYAQRSANGASDYAIWVCAPHAGDDNYFTQMGVLFKQRLNPAIKVRLEYSNETWNSGLFTQGQYTLQQGIAANIAPGDTGFDNQIFFSSRRHQQLWTLFKAGWDSVNAADSDSRVIRVMGGWATNPDYNRKILQFENAWEDCDEIALAPYFDGVGIPYEDTVEGHWAPVPSTTYSFTLGTYTFSYTTPADLDMNLSEPARRQIMVQNLLSQVEASPMITNPDSRFDFVLPLREDDGTMKGIRFFYKLERSFMPKLAYSSPTVPGFNTSLPYRHSSCRLNNSYFDDLYKGLPHSWSDRERFENWRLSLTAAETLGFCMAETSPGGQLSQDLQAHIAMLNAQSWTKKPRIVFYEVGTHLYSSWMSSDARSSQLLTTLLAVEASPQMRTLVNQYVSTLQSVAAANNIGQCVINWFSLSGTRSKFGTWGLWLPDASEKWHALLDWISVNHY